MIWKREIIYINENTGFSVYNNNNNNNNNNGDIFTKQTPGSMLFV